MSTIKIGPRNLNAIQRHFEKCKHETLRKLNAINKKKLELEKELETYKDGVAWCQEIYKIGAKEK